MLTPGKTQLASLRMREKKKSDRVLSDSLNNELKFFFLSISCRDLESCDVVVSS